VPSSSDPTGSIVLLGRKDMDDSAAPIVVPELQNIGVIKCVLLSSSASSRRTSS